ncbi:MAG: GNAT family N-acetyltransferase [Caldilineaceae bacterium]
MTSQHSVAPNVEFHMLRDDMDNIPEYELPAGYRFRCYREGDERTWLDLHRAGEPFIEITPDLFQKQFASGADILPERMFFVETADGAAAGCITAWWDKNRYGEDERGRIHWVIVHPDHRRLGIANAMMTQAMKTLREHYRWALLGTSSGRPYAVKTYLNFGFYPDPNDFRDEDALAAWERVQAQIDHPLLRSTLAAVTRAE